MPSTTCCKKNCIIRVIQGIQNNADVGTGVLVEAACHQCGKTLSDAYVVHFPVGAGRASAQPLTRIRARRNPREYLLDQVRAYAAAMRSCHEKHGAEVVEGLNAWHLVAEADRITAGRESTLAVTDKELERIEGMLRRALERIDGDLAESAKRNALRGLSP